MAPLHFPFAELTFTHALGPAPGRYVVRPEGTGGAVPEFDGGVVGPTLPVGSADVLVIRVDGAATGRRPRLRAPRARETDPGEPQADVALSVATVIFATEQHRDAAAAQAQLAGWQADAGSARPVVARALHVVNRAIRAYRAAAADPYVIEVTDADPRTVRVGYGSSGVADGQWEQALLLPPVGAGRLGHAQRLRPTQVVADVLAGRGTVLDGEDVLLRAVLDIEHGRPEAGAAQLQLAVQLLLGVPDGPGARLEALQAPLAAVRAQLADPGDRHAARAQLQRLAAAAGEAIDAWRLQQITPAG